jgi:nitroimidazol reductase NimA-like FMN-containing flavoprotein (pyridoxamine 5'-phosphate oxidase superfamily)
VIAADDAAALAGIQRASYERAGGIKGAWPQADALDEAGIADLLGRRRYCVLATARPDARAHAAPVAFVVAGGAFWFGTVEGLRLRNLRSTPWASVVVMEGDRDAQDPHRALTAEGATVLHEGAAFGTAFEPLRETWIARHGREPDWAVALVELRPERLFSYSAA